jgi:hypothetical protein
MTGSPETEWTARFRASMPPQPEGACPPPETLWRAVRGELSGDELESFGAHLRTCSECGEALAVSAEVVAGSENRPLAWTPRRPGRIAAAAGGLTALAAGLLVFLIHHEPVPSDSHGPDLTTSRGEGNAGVTIGPLSKEEQPAGDARLQWTPVPGAVRYRVQLSTEDLRPVHDRTLEGTTLVLPPGLAGPSNEGMAREQQVGRSGRIYLWQVEAMLADGRTVTSSTFRVRLVPTSPGLPR